MFFPAIATLFREQLNKGPRLIPLSPKLYYKTFGAYAKVSNGIGYEEESASSDLTTSLFSKSRFH
jgi:hypothetical protein